MARLFTSAVGVTLETMVAQRELTDLQLMILNVLWQRPGQTVAEVHSALAEHVRPTRQTVNTLLWRLERRGLVKRRVRNGQGLYEPAVNRRRLITNRLSALLSALFDSGADGHPSALRAGDIASGDTARLKALIRKAERELDLGRPARPKK